MGGSSISASVTAANSKLAQMLRSREEDEALLQIGKRKIKDQAARESDFGGRTKKAKRWSQKADFSYPSPLVDRPRTAAGSTSFHFSYTTISKQGSPTSGGKPLPGFGGGRQPGADHAVYVERDGAAELSEGVEHAAYVERDEAVEQINVISPIDHGRERGLGQDIGEDLLPEEAATLGPVASGVVQSVFTNISGDKFERTEYWRAVHRTEREAKTHAIIVDPSQCPRWWTAIEDSKHLPADFKQHCLMQRDRYDAWLKSQADNPRSKPFVAEPYERTANGIGSAIEAARLVDGWDNLRPPIQFKSGPGGRVQLRFVAELPVELRAEDRALIVQNFCDYLGSFAKDEAGNTVGLMYTAVVHAPDAHNDRRNYHLHIIAHDRPAKWMPHHGAWDFEVSEVYVDPGSRKDRVRHPHRQNKIVEVTRKLNEDDRSSKPHFNNAIAGRDFIPHLRRKFAEINNLVLSQRGIQRRLDPRRYEEMGIDRTPTEHLGTRAAALEAMGVPTIVGRLNAIAIWDDAERAIRKRAAVVGERLSGTQKELRDLAAEALASPVGQDATRPFRQLVAERDVLIRDIADDRRELMIFDHLEAKAKSRAVRTRQTCLQTLTEAARIPGIHSSTTVKLVRKRYDEAQAHIERVNHELSFDRPRIKAAAEDVLRREERIHQIDQQLAHLRASVLQSVENSKGYLARKKARVERDAADLKTILAQEARAASNASPKPIQTAPPAAIAAEPVPSVTSSPKLPVVATAVPSPTVHSAKTVHAAKKEKPNDRRQLTTALALVGSINFAARQLGARATRTLRTTRALSSLRGLSGIGVVRDLPRRPLLLQDLKHADLGRRELQQQPGPGDGVRRERDRHPDVAGGNGKGERNVVAKAEGISSPPATVTPSDVGPEAAPIMAPPSIGGLPIVEPVLPPTTDAITLPAQHNADLPGGLDPLRPVPVPVPHVPAEPSAAIDITSPETTNTPTSQAPVTPAQPSADTPVDKRKKVEDPTLFPVQPSVAPTKPGTAKASYEDWDALINEISRQRTPVSKSFDQNGKVQYSVPGLTADQTALIAHERFAARTASRLTAIHEQQDREIDRLVRWIEKNGTDPKALVIKGRTATLGNATDSIRSLYRQWGQSEKVKTALRSEHARRAKEDARAQEEALPQKAEAPTAAAVASLASEAVATTARLAQLAEIYPSADNARTRQVYYLIKLLLADAPAEQIKQAAEAVSLDAVAREDVHRNGVELARVYNAALDDDITHLARACERGGSSR